MRLALSDAPGAWGFHRSPESKTKKQKTSRQIAAVAVIMTVSEKLGKDTVINTGWTVRGWKAPVPCFGGAVLSF